MRAEGTTPTTRTYPCEGCGADLAYASDAEELACPYCGLRVAIGLGAEGDVRERDLGAVLARVASQRAEGRSRDPEELASRCRSCSAVVVFRGTLTSKSCAYCGSPIQRGDVHRAEDRIGVDAVLPFRLSREQARDAVRGWLRSLWLAPKSFTAKRVPDRVRSVYLPFWTFDALTSSFYRGWRQADEEDALWEKCHGSFRHVFDDVAVPADGSLVPDLTRGLEPWPTEQVRPYRPEFLAGQLAKTYDVPLAEGWKRGRERMEDILRKKACEHMGGHFTRLTSIRTRWEALSYKHVLLPVFMLAIRDSGGLHRVLVNGATGKVSGQRPWSALKVACLAAVVAAILIACLLARN